MTSNHSVLISARHGRRTRTTYASCATKHDTIAERCQGRTIVSYQLVSIQNRYLWATVCSSQLSTHQIQLNNRLMWSDAHLHSPDVLISFLLLSIRDLRYPDTSMSPKVWPSGSLAFKKVATANIGRHLAPHFLPCIIRSNL